MYNRTNHSKSNSCTGPRFAGVVTIIPDENGSEDEPVIMWRGVTRPCTAYPDASLGPRARPTDALGVPRTVLPLSPVLACYTVPGLGAGGYQMDYENTKSFTKPEQVTLPQRRPNTQAMAPHIKMVVSDWYTDEFGNKARIIKARD